MQVFRHEVPVDDEYHAFAMPAAEIVKVGCRRVDRVEFWFLDTGGPDIMRTFAVFGTGQNVPDTYVYVGTAEPVADGMLVWHLFERIAP